MNRPVLLALVTILIVAPAAAGTALAMPVGGAAQARRPQVNYVPLNIVPASAAIGGPDGYYSQQEFQIEPPNETPIVIWIGKNIVFNHTGLPYNVTVYVPPGNYSLILLNMSIRELGGTQYDVVAYVFADGVPLLWGSTQEILNSTAEVDVTLFEKLLQGNVRFQVMVPNGYAPSIGITGYYIANVSLLLYKGSPPPNLPNYFIPLFVNKLGYSSVTLNAYDDYAEEQVQIPNGTYRAWLLLYTKGSAYDEFWYTNEPPVRYVKVLYDGRLAGVVNPFETVYTGGINLFWWKPVTSINTLAFHMPYFIDLTPMLAYGLNASIALSVADLQESSQVMGVPGGEFQWTLAGVLMLWVNSSNPMMSAEVLESYVNYKDSGPMFFPSYEGIYFDEGASYDIIYESRLNFEHGYEVASVTQEGTVTARQVVTNYAGTFSFIYLDEAFNEMSAESGTITNSTLSIMGNYPVTLYYDFSIIPITSPSVFPFNATYSQNGTFYLAPSYYIKLVDDGYNLTEWQDYDLEAEGGFAGILEFINPTGAVLISLTKNNDYTVKTLNAGMLVNGHGFKEYAEMIGFQNSTINTAGYLLKKVISYQEIGGGLP